MLVDTDVLIWHLRGNAKAQKAIDHQKEFSISSVTYMEILSCLRDMVEMKNWKAFLKNRSVHHILIDHDIILKALYWMEEFVLSHQLRMADALIAATAETHGMELLTGNGKDYQYLPGLKIKHFKVQCSDGN